MFKRIQIVGNVGKDPEIRQLPGGAVAASFGVACNEQWTDRETGEVTKKVTWFNLVAYQNGEKGLITSLIGPWIKSGQLVFVDGDPQIRKWTDQQGNQRYSFEIKLGPQSTIRMLGGRAERPPNGEDAPDKGPAEPNGERVPAFDDDGKPIPF
jgi:single-strand DNA-binding protein